MRAVVLLALVGAGCHAAFVDERAAGPVGTGDAVDGADLGAGMRVGQGGFHGRAGHVAAGGVELWSYDGGVAEVRFAADFGVSDVPGPVVVLSSRDTLGTALDPVAGDIELATLLHPDGAQSYFGRLTAPPPPFVYVFCKPYGLEVGKAVLQR